MANHNLNTEEGRMSYAQLYLKPPVTQKKADAFVKEYLHHVLEEHKPPPLARKLAKETLK